MKVIEIPEDDLRKIHTRLDVQDQAISRLIELLINLDVFYYRDAEEILDMLEESQNPFEVSDENDS